jgi:hypothetical protein
MVPDDATSIVDREQPGTGGEDDIAGARIVTRGFIPRQVFGERSGGERDCGARARDRCAPRRDLEAIRLARLEAQDRYIGRRIREAEYRRRAIEVAPGTSRPY